MVDDDGLRLTDRKRRDILDAAAREFERDGFDRASMNRIAAAANVSKRTVYNHFASKEELFLAILDDLLDRPAKVTSVEYTPSRSLETQLRRIGRDFVKMMMSEDFVRVARVVISRFVQAPEFAATIAVDTRSKESLARWIQAAAKDGQLSVRDPMRAAREFTALISEFALWPQVLGNKPPLSPREQGQVVSSATKMILALYATSETSPKKRSS